MWIVNIVLPFMFKNSELITTNYLPGVEVENYANDF